MDVTAEQSFAELLRVARQRAKMTQRQLAEQAGISARAVSDLERGINRAPRAATMSRLADALDLSDDERHLWKAVSALGLPDTSAEQATPNGAKSFPRPLTSFVGRDDEIESISKLLSQTDVRLVTLTGPGGVGKTRLALAVAEPVAPAFPDGVYIVNLAPLSDPSLVIPNVAQALGVRVAGIQTFQQAVSDWLRRRTVLIVLDNVEHLLRAAPEIAELLNLNPGLTILATSRAPLRISAEREIQVLPLSLPAIGQRVFAVDLEGASAIRLFVDRAQAVRANFRLTDENAATIAAICARLDGLPLAIELAAARLRLLSPSDLLARLAHSLPLLVDGPRDVPARQQTLIDTIAWSYNLLAEPEQRLFRQLTIFAGGWTLDSAIAVCDPDLDVLSGMAALVDRNLIRIVTQPNGKYRYMMLETIREYGSALLAEYGESEFLAARHASQVLQMIESVKAGLHEARAVDWISSNREEIDNIRAALRYRHDHAEIELMLQIALAAFDIWLVLSLVPEYRDWLLRGLALADEVPLQLRADAFTTLGGCSHAIQDHETAERALRAAIPLHEELDNRVGLSWSIHWLGWTMMMRGRRDLSADLFTRALELARTTNDPWLLGDVLIGRALVLTFTKEWDEAITLAEESLEIYRTHGDRSSTAHCLHVLGFLSLWKGDVDLAERYGKEALHCASPDDPPILSNVHELLATIALERFCFAEAGRLFRSALNLSSPEDDPVQLVECLEGLAGIAVACGDPIRAATLLGAVEAIRERKSIPLLPPYQPGHDRTVASIQEVLSNEQVTVAWQVGRGLSSREANDLGLELDAKQDASPAVLPQTILSPRELDVLRLLVEGLSDREIADALFISRHTVAHHVTSILNKLGVASRTAAATFAVREHLI